MFTALFFGVALGGGIYVISLYGDIVDLRHNIRDQEAYVQQLHAENGESQQQLYAILDAKNLEDKAKELGLILDTHPRYLETEKAPLATKL